MTAAVVIPAYNAAATLGLCLSAVQAQSVPPREIFVVDDGSTDDTAALARRFGVSYIRMHRQGPAAARNAGAKRADTEIVAFTDADCIPERDWLAKLAAAFAHTDAAAVGGSYAIANSRSLLARLVHAEIVERHRTMREDADFLGSFNVAYRRESFLAAGGFNEAYGNASGEDNDLAYRLHDAGARLLFRRDIRVAHHHPERLWPYLRTQARHGYWRVKLHLDHRGRSGGDQYAGLVDLLAPPAALGLAASAIALAAAIAAQQPVAMATQAWLIAAAFYAALRFTFPLRILWHSRNPEAMLLWPLLMVRDGARALGLISGVWRFGVRRGEAS